MNDVFVESVIGLDRVAYGKFGGGAGVTGALEAIEEMKMRRGSLGSEQYKNVHFHVYFSKVSTYSYVESVHGNSFTGTHSSELRESRRSCVYYIRAN